MEEFNQILENDEEFKKYNEILNSPFGEGAIVKYNGEIKKYVGYIVNRLYEGRGILYNDSGQIIYNGFFKRGKFEGFGKKYIENQFNL